MEENLVEVEIIASSVTTSQYGTLATGDKLRTSPEFAKHLVQDAKAAKYTNAEDADAAGVDPATEGARSMPAADEEPNKRAGTADPERHGTAAKSTRK